MQTDQWDGLLSVGEAAAALGVSRQRLYVLLKTGAVPGRRVVLGRTGFDPNVFLPWRDEYRRTRKPPAKRPVTNR